MANPFFVDYVHKMPTTLWTVTTIHKKTPAMAGALSVVHMALPASAWVWWGGTYLLWDRN